MLRKVLIAVMAAVVAVVGLLVAVKYQSDKSFYDGYSAEWPLNPVLEPSAIVEGTVKAFGQTLPARYERHAFTFESQPGERVPALLTLPLDAEESRPLPVIILIHGSHQEKEFVEQICTPFNEAGFAMVCFDQYMRASRKVSGGLRDTTLAFRDRCRKTVHEAQRLIDYLVTRPDIDANRIYLIGASYGAITGTVALARDKRFRAGALVVGGGNWHILAQAPEVRQSLPRWMWPFAGMLMSVVAGPADPVRHAAQTAGTPVLMLNGSNDKVVIPEAGQALFDALGEPKEIRWYPVDHPDREPNGEEVIKMLDDGLQWMLAQDVLFRGK